MQRLTGTNDGARTALIYALMCAPMWTVGCSGSGAEPNGPTASEIADGAYLPDDGLLVVDLESGSPSGGWTAETALAGFTGGSYLRWAGANLFGTPGTDPFGFDFWIEDPGRYHFRIHNRHDDPDSTMANDLWVRMDGGDWVKAFSWQRGQWTWATQHEFSPSDKPQAEYTLARGNHRIEFSGRSFDYMVDRFHLYDDGVVDPLNVSHPESSAFGASGLTDPGARQMSDSDNPGTGSPRPARLEVAPFFQESLVGSGASRPLTAEESRARFDEAWGHSAPALARAKASHQGVDVVLARGRSIAQGGWDLTSTPPGEDAASEAALSAVGSATTSLPDVRWVFEAGPGLDPGTLASFARGGGAIAGPHRPQILRAGPSEILRAWPDVLHGPFDGLMILASGESLEEVAACLACIEASGRPFTVEIRGGSETSGSSR